MIQYPKVPRYGLPFVTDEFWSGELYATEKADGSLFRFTVYDSAHSDAYTDEVREMAAETGDIVAGTSNHVRWTVHTDGSISGDDPGEYRDALGLLGTIFADDALDLIDEHGPIVCFAEAMTGHLLEYDADTPALLGFDAYAPYEAGRDTIGMPPTHAAARYDTDTLVDHPGVPLTTDSTGETVIDESFDYPDSAYQVGFDGFFGAEEALEAFERIGIPPMHPPDAIPTVEGEAITPDEFTVPVSQFTDKQAEGVVFRNPRTGQRVKVRSTVFNEVKSHHHAHDSGGEADPVERFIAEYATPVRIMDVVLEMVREDDYEMSMSIIDDARRRVYDDIWQEEWRTIKEQPYPIRPDDIKSRLAGRTADVVEKMLNDEAVIIPENVADDSPISFR